MNYHDTDDGSEEDTGQDQLTGNRKRSSRGTGSTLGPCASLKPTRSLRPVQEDEGELVVLPAPTLSLIVACIVEVRTRPYGCSV